MNNKGGVYTMSYLFYLFIILVSITIITLINVLYNRTQRLAKNIESYIDENNIEDSEIKELRKQLQEACER